MSGLTRRSRRPSGEDDDEATVGFSRLLGGLGLLALVAGTTIIAVPGLDLPMSPRYFLVIVVGAVLLVLAVTRWLARLGTPIDSARLPTVEERSTVSVPGVDFDERLPVGGRTPTDRFRQRERVRTRLHDVATALVGDRTAGGDGDIEAQLMEGTWTDDAAAAALFTDGDSSAALGTRITALFSGGSVFQRRVERTIAELSRIAGMDDADTVDLEVSGERSTRPTGAGEHTTERWNGLVALALSTIGFGVLLTRPALVLGGGVLAGFGAYALAGSSPEPDLAITRTIKASEPDPDTPVTVRVEIENIGSNFQPDLRFVDGVPPGVSVEEGTPRHGTALRPGASTTYTYTVVAMRGTHEFESPHLVARNLPGTIERVSRPTVDGDAAITYDVSSLLDFPVPLRKQAARHVGRLLTDVSGSGIEFHSLRQYRTGDPLARIDWNRVARGDGLATLRFHEERSATVIVLIDARREAYVAPNDATPSAVDRSVLGAARVVTALLDSDDLVGLGSISPRRCWLDPGGGHSQRARANDLLATHEAFSPAPPDSPYHPDIRLPALRKRLPGSAQLIVFSPVVDDEAAEILRRLQANGHSVTLISPDATAGGTAGRRLARLERSVRLSKLRQATVRVVDWDDGESLAVALTEASRRWS